MPRNHTMTLVILTTLSLGCIAAGLTALSRKDIKKSTDRQVFSTEASWVQDFTKMPEGQPSPKEWNMATVKNPIYNNEAQVYTDRVQNVRIEKGALVLEAHKESHAGKQYTSGRIDTRNHQTFKYGKIEATMSLPTGKGTWPALWLLSNTDAYTKALRPTAQQWAQSRFYMHDGEIDIMEQIGADPRRIESTVHTYARSDQKGTTIAGDPTTFHTYGVLWTPDSLTFTFDGSAYHTLPKASNNPDEWPFDQDMYLIINLAMGGKMGGEIDDSHSPWKVLVQRVAYYPYIGVDKK